MSLFYSLSLSLIHECIINTCVTQCGKTDKAKRAREGESESESGWQLNCPLKVSWRRDGKSKSQFQAINKFVLYLR